MQRLVNLTEVPPGQFVFVCPETGFRIVSLNRQEWFVKIQKHYIANGLVLPEDWKAIVEDRFCQGLPPGWCEFVSGEPIAYEFCNITKAKLINGAVALATLIKETFFGREVFVDQAEADLRAEICVKCPFNISVNACMGCSGMSALVNAVGQIKGTRTTKYDGQLKNCCKCLCRNEAIVHIKKEILNSGQSPEDMLQYPLWCWKLDQPLEIAKDKLSL